MKILCGGYALLHIRTLVAIVSREKIVEALGWGRDGLVIRRSGPLDPRLGVVAAASGLLSGARFYAPEIKTVSRMHAGTNCPRRWKRYYNEDWVVDPQHKALPPAIAGDALRYKERCYQVLAYMFPSAGGLLTISTEVGDSLYKRLMSHPEMKGKGPRVLAALLAMALGARLEGSTASVPSPRKKKWAPIS